MLPARTLAVALLLAAPAALAHGDAVTEGERMLLLHDAEPGGHAVAGSLTHLGFALVDAAGTPVAHHDNTVRVTHENRVLFETAHAHEYDGLFGLELTLPNEGAYAANATTTSDDTGASGRFTGHAVQPAEVGARVELDVPAQTRALAPTPLTVAVVNATGELIPHSDAIVEVRRATDGGLVQRFHGHTHEEVQAFLVAFPAAGAYEVHVTGYNAFPTPDRSGWKSVHAAAEVTVNAPNPVDASPGAHAAGPLAGDVLRDGDDPVLHLTTDPTSFLGGATEYPFGPGTLLRFNGLVTDADGATAVQHVDFEAALQGPAGPVFESGTLHEYDGHFELTVGDLAPGDYRFTLHATRGDWTATVQKTVRIHPPVAPLTPGAYNVHLSPVENARAGDAVDLQFSLRDALDRPLSHGEVDVTILPADGGAQVASFKLHTHASGDMAARYAFPDAGEWIVRATPSILEAKAAVAQAADFRIDVAPGDTPDAAGLDAPPDTADVPAPGLPILVALVLLVAAVNGPGGGNRGRGHRTRDTRPAAWIRGR